MRKVISSTHAKIHCLVFTYVGPIIRTLGLYVAILIGIACDVVMQNTFGKFKIFLLVIKPSLLISY
jgi:hypothetical protein